MRLRPESALLSAFGTALPVAGFSATDARLSERADVGSVLLAAAVEPAGLSSAASAAAGVALPCAAGVVGTGAGRLALWLSPRSWLVLCAVRDEVGLATRINSMFNDKRLHAALYTDGLCWLELSGVQSLALLTETSFLSLEPRGLPLLHAKRTLIAGIAATIIRVREDGYLVGVERSRARYFVDWLSASAR